MKEHKNSVIPLLVTSLFFMGCSTAPDVRPGEGTELMSEEEEIQFGNFVDAAITEEFVVLEGHEATEAVKRIGADLVRVSDRPALPFTFKVLNTTMVNAFAGPGGYVYITTGLLDLLDSKNEVAAVLAHEIGHVTGRHSIRALYNASIAEGALAILDIASIATAIFLGIPLDLADLGRAVGYITTIMVYQGYSRSYESQADRLGVRYADSAGYDPEAFVGVFKKFLDLRKKEGGEEEATILSSHPALEDRIAEVEGVLAQMRRERAKKKEAALPRTEALFSPQKG